MMFVKNEMVDDHMEYLVTIADPDGGDSTQIKDRYSSMRSFWEDLTANFDQAAPAHFPPKKCCGNTNQDFVSHRMRDLERFFNQVFSNPRLAKSAIAKAYVEGKRVARKVRPAEDEKHKPPTDAQEEPKVNVPERPEAKKPAYEPPHMPLDKIFRKTADTTTNKYIDISFTEEPPPIEEIKAKTRKYGVAIEKDIQTIPYMTKLLGMPRGEEQPLSVDQVENERAMAEWLTKKMEDIFNLVTNKMDAIYPRETIQFEFSLT